MPGYVWGALATAVLVSVARVTVFCLALHAHRRWKVSVADLVKLIQACFPRRPKSSARRTSPGAPE